jgi:hypothetical protein
MTWPTGAPNILDAPADVSPLAWNPDDSVKPWSADPNKLSWTPLLGRRQKSEEH